MEMSVQRYWSVVRPVTACRFEWVPGRVYIKNKAALSIFLWEGDILSTYKLQKGLVQMENQEIFYSVFGHIPFIFCLMAHCLHIEILNITCKFN